MTVKLTPAQTEALYGIYEAYRNESRWSIYSTRRPTLKILQNRELITSSYPEQLTEDRGLPLAIELGFPTRYEAEKQKAAVQKQSDEAQQAEWRKLLEISDTITAPHIMDNQRKWSNIHYWSVRFSTGITIVGWIDSTNIIDDTVLYEIHLDNIRLPSTAEVTTFLKEMYAANTLLAKLQTGLIGKVETKPYEPSVLAMLPNKAVGS